MIRAVAPRYDDTSPRCVLWETFSDDGGATWVQPFRTPLWGSLRICSSFPTAGFCARTDTGESHLAKGLHQC